MKTAAFRYKLYSPWMILTLAVIAWGPVFIADWVADAFPSLAAEYAPQSFALRWMGITIMCSVTAIVLAIIHSVRLIFRLFRGDKTGGPSPMSAPPPRATDRTRSRWK